MNNYTGRIVVGYDGSESAGIALDWATDQAERHGLPLTVICVVDYVGMLPGIYGPSSWPTLFQEEGNQLAAKAEQRARKRAASIDISAEAFVGQVADILIKVSPEV